jgi:DNA invertase Pin-like site-specific DNA recombinase
LGLTGKEYPGHALDLKSSMGRAMFTIISGFAQLERDIIRERTMAGQERARAQGKKLGRLLKSGKVYRRPALTEVAKLHSQGQSIREIATQLETSKYWVEYSMNEIRRTHDKLKGCLCRRGIFQRMFRLSESGVFQTDELPANTPIFPGSMVREYGPNT